MPARLTEPAARPYSKPCSSCRTVRSCTKAWPAACVASGLGCYTGSTYKSPAPQIATTVCRDRNHVVRHSLYFLSRALAPIRGSSLCLLEAGVFGKQTPGSLNAEPCQRHVLALRSPQEIGQIRPIPCFCRRAHPARPRPLTINYSKDGSFCTGTAGFKSCKVHARPHNTHDARIQHPDNLACGLHFDSSLMASNNHFLAYLSPCHQHPRRPFLLRSKSNLA